MNTTIHRTTANLFAKKCVASCEKILAQIIRARNAIATEFRENLQASDRLVQLALNEAEALAWQTDYPHLLFPTLAQEKIQAVATWNRRPQSIRKAQSDYGLAA